MSTLSGHRERPHTADWSLDVWAYDLPSLFEEAARGMAELMDLRLRPGPRSKRRIQIPWSDAEGSLVGFLSELLYLDESEGLGFDRIQVTIHAGLLIANLEVAPIAAQAKEIKAVTYHNLAVHQVDDHLETTIVFDV
ncbi:MAG TPA: archease [Anaerolineaceae bacterium]|nr:archease [Anaerolineaceae bacterium]